MGSTDRRRCPDTRLRPHTRWRDARAWLPLLLLSLPAAPLACQDGYSPPATSTAAVDDPDPDLENNRWPDPNNTATNNTAPNSDTPDPDPGDLDWEPCDLYSSGGGPAAECASFPLPILWGDPLSQTIPVFLKRLPAAEPATGQLWLLQGGPGGSGEGMEGLAALFAEEHPSLDIYIPDHRGTGRSARLGCPEEERFDTRGSALIVDAEWLDCMTSVEDTWGIYLEGFTTTAAARDLDALIERVRQDDQQVFVLGISYGTYWAHRYLQLYPDRADGVILDSVCPPGTCTMPGYDLRFNATAQTFFDRCAEDDLCRSKLGTRPWMTVEAVYAKIEQGICPQLFDLGINRESLRQTLGALFKDWTLRVYVPAVIHRIERCSDADVRALTRFADRLGLRAQFTFRDPGLDSDVLGAHIMLSEMWGEDAPPLETIASYADNAYVSLDAAMKIAWLEDSWPRYAPEPLATRWATTDVPILMLNGTLDPQTPMSISHVAADHLNAPAQHFVTIPDAAHATLIQSPTTDGSTCGLDLTHAFLRDPDAPPDTSCIDRLKPIDFDGITEYSEYLFNEPDMWENRREKSAPRPGLEPPGLQAVRREVERARRGIAPPLR